MDRQIGRLRDELKRLKIAENTLIFFVSDNGAARPLLRSGAASTGPYRGSKHTMYEGGVRVPALVEWPGYISPARTSTMVSSLDFLPTILNLDGLKPPKELSERPLDGESFKSLLDGDYSWQRQNPIMAGWMRIYRNQHGISLISNRYKLLKDTEKNRYELYDVLSDPSETTDLSGEYPEVVADMRQLLEEWLNSTKESRDGADYSY
jgi:arylsulfatase A-like enzyme